MYSVRARLTLGTTLVALLVMGAIPVGAAHTSPHASDEVWAIETQAEEDMDDVVAAFAAQIADLGSTSEVAQAENAADAAVLTIWSDARTAIDDLVTQYPGLGGVGGQAKQQLQQARNAARTAISELGDGWAPAATTTTTTVTSTTTTVVNATTTTTTATTTTTHGTGSGVVPPAPGNGNGNTNGNSDDPPRANDSGGSGGQTIAPGNDPVPSPIGDSDRIGADSVDDQVGSNVLTLAAQTPEQLSDGDTAEVSESLETSGTETTAVVSAMLETVLPPAVVDLVLSPLLILEILFRTTLDGGQRIFAPLALLALCAAMISLTDRFSRRASRATAPTHQ
ncbi:MAG: hypothetical protein WD473_05105 [Acidimicrobiia bacterium]